MVEIADASDPTKMPALAIANVAITTIATVDAVVSGRCVSQITDTITGGAINSPLYVKSGGGLTVTKPTGIHQIQKVGFIGRDHSSAGIIQVVGAGRTNDVPNNFATDSLRTTLLEVDTLRADSIKMAGDIIFNDSTAKIGMTDTLGGDGGTLVNLILQRGW